MVILQSPITQGFWRIRYASVFVHRHYTTPKATTPIGGSSLLRKF
jgi:hypothetical protein